MTRPLAGATLRHLATGAEAVLVQYAEGPEGQGPDPLVWVVWQETGLGSGDHSLSEFAVVQ
jgi:hypothetical protein